MFLSPVIVHVDSDVFFLIVLCALDQRSHGAPLPEQLRQHLLRDPAGAHPPPDSAQARGPWRAAELRVLGESPTSTLPTTFSLSATATATATFHCSPGSASPPLPTSLFPVIYRSSIYISLFLSVCCSHSIFLSLSTTLCFHLCWEKQTGKQNQTNERRYILYSWWH